jgi:hypothetical protein
MAEIELSVMSRQCLDKRIPSRIRLRSILSPWEKRRNRDGACVVDNTTQEDRAALVRWMFLALSRHPAVQGIANMDDEALDAANQSMGELITRLLAGTCREETRTAVNYEGEATITAAFTLLGQVAATELMGHPEVASAMSGLETHIDEDALAEVFAED